LISSDEQMGRESSVNLHLERLKAMLLRFPSLRDQRETWRKELLSTSRELAGRTVGLPKEGLKLLFTPEGLEATQQFIQQGRAFDPKITDGSLHQGLRNLWVMHSIQLLLGRPVALTPSLFAYSMLYPCTDNFLDNSDIPGEAKTEFGNWLARRLQGDRTTPPSSHAEQVSRLVALIESAFPRTEFEAVYFSLRAIHDAQTTSLDQHRTEVPLSDEEVLRITTTKGGTSVLADACLIVGQISEAEADFMFGYGVLLQLMDDLQDLSDDLSKGHATLFSRQAADGFLDELTSRLWNFSQTVLWSSTRFEAPEFRPLKALIQDNCKLLLVQTVARNPAFYTLRFSEELENCSPFSFGFLRSRETTLHKEASEIISTLRCRGRIRSTFDFLN